MLAESIGSLHGKVVDSVSGQILLFTVDSSSALLGCKNAHKNDNFN